MPVQLSVLTIVQKSVKSQIFVQSELFSGCIKYASDEICKNVTIAKGRNYQIGESMRLFLKKPNFSIIPVDVSFGGLALLHRLSR